MPRPRDPNSRTVPVTIKVTRTEAEFLRRLGGTPGKGLRRILANLTVATPYQPEETE